MKTKNTYLDNLKRLRTVLIIAGLLGLLTSCLTAQKGTDGYYKYDYCLAVPGEKSAIIFKKDSTTDLKKMKISGQVVDLKSRKPIFGAIVTLTTVNENGKIQQVTDSTGHFSFIEPKNTYQIGADYIGYNKFQSKISINQNCFTEIGMGKASGVVTYEIKSKSRLSKLQLKQRAIELNKQNQDIK